MQDTLLRPAFADPVMDAQHIFRLALSAMSEPGTRQHISEAPTLNTIDAASYVLCLTLLDADTPLWIAPALDSASLRANLAFHCGCPLVNDRGAAAFALLSMADLDDLDGFRVGTDRDPDLSVTLIVQLESLEGGPALACEGPGIETQRTLHLPVSTGLWRQRREHLFPRGLDMFFTAGSSFVALPRSTRVSPAMQEGR